MPCCRRPRPPPRHLPCPRSLLDLCARALRHTIQTQYSCFSEGFKGPCTYVLVSPDGLVDIAGGELVKLLVVSEDDDSNIN